jgi:hypothetical protein
MSKDFEIIDTKFDKILSNNEGKINLLTFLTIVFVLLYAIIYNLFLTPMGLVALTLITLLYKFFYGTH